MNLLRKQPATFIFIIRIEIRSGNAVFAISGGSAVYASRSNFREFDADNLDHQRSACKIKIIILLVIIALIRHCCLSNANQHITKM